jgi:hypothetical protein
MCCTCCTTLHSLHRLIGNVMMMMTTLHSRPSNGWHHAAHKYAESDIKFKKRRQLVQPSRAPASE